MATGAKRKVHESGVLELDDRHPASDQEGHRVSDGTVALWVFVITAVVGFVTLPHIDIQGSSPVSDGHFYWLMAHHPRTLYLVPHSELGGRFAFRMLTPWVVGAPPPSDPATLPVSKVFGRFAPYRVPTNIADQLGKYVETVAPGALRQTLAERGADGTELRLQHGRHPVVGALPVGVFEALYEDERGGWFSARPLDASSVRELVLPAMRADQMFTSFGFRGVRCAER